MSIEHFTDSEKIVMLSLMRNPEHRDTDIVKATGMNLFTFNKIKNSLLRRQLLVKYYVPNYSRLGFEILIASSGSGQGELLGSSELMKLHDSINEELPSKFIFSLKENNQGLFFSVLRDYTEMKRIWNLKRTIVDMMDLREGKIEHSIFSLRKLWVERFFDVQSLLSRELDDQMEIPKLPAGNVAQEMASLSWIDFFSHGEGETTYLNEIEDRLLFEIVRTPSAKESDLIEKLDVSRYKYTRIKEDLLRRKMIKPFYATSPMHMGYDVLIFGHMRFAPGKKPLELLKRYSESIPENLISIVYDSMEGIFIGIYRNLSKASEAVSIIRDKMNELDFLEEEPNIKIFSLPNCIGEMSLSFHLPFLGMKAGQSDNDMIEELTSIISRYRGSQHRSPPSP